MSILTRIPVGTMVKFDVGDDPKLILFTPDSETDYVIIASTEPLEASRHRLSTSFDKCVQTRVVQTQRMHSS